MLPPITNFAQIGCKTQKLLKLERFAWSHWIQKYLFYFGHKFRPSPQAAPEAPQLSQTSSRKNGKPSISRMAQKIELVIRLFSGLKNNVKDAKSANQLNRFCAVIKNNFGLLQVDYAD